MKSGYDLEQYWIFKPGILEQWAILEMRISGTLAIAMALVSTWDRPLNGLFSTLGWKVKAGWNDCKKNKQHELFGDIPDLVESGTFTDFFWSQNETLVLVSDGIMTWHGNLLWTGDGIVPSSCQYLSLDLHSCWVNSCEIPKLIQITSSIFFGLPVYPLYKL